MSEKSNVLPETINRLIEAIPQSEGRLRGQLAAVREVYEFDQARSDGVYGDPTYSTAHGWKRTTQLFSNRVLELKQITETSGTDMPDWVAAGTTIIDGYGRPGLRLAEEDDDEWTVGEPQDFGENG